MAKSPFGDLIHSYSRAEALADGVLVDLSALVPGVCRQFFKVPVACTAAVWGIIERAINNPRYSNDIDGVVFDLCWMARHRGNRVAENTLAFEVIIRGAGPRTLHCFRLVCGPDDEGKPAITVMLPEED